MRGRWLSLLLLAALVQGAQTFVVAAGVSSYDDPTITPLNYAADDARAIAGAFRAVGVPEANVRLLVSDAPQGAPRPSKFALLRTIQQVREQTGPDDTLIFFFAGHGIQQADTPFLLTTDSIREDLTTTALPMSSVRSLLTGLQAKHLLFILDACRNDPDGGRATADAQLDEGFARGMRPMLMTAGAERTAALLLACDVGQRAYEIPDQRHGALTWYLLKGLAGEARGADGAISVNSLGTYILREVPAWALRNRRRQTPRFENPSGADFPLVPSSGPVVDHHPRLPHLFSDGLVLQQGMPVPIWGWADDGATVSVSFAGQTKTTVARDGRWLVRLDPLVASARPTPLTVTAGTTLTLPQVYVGEVWLAGGQSNMTMALRDVEHAEALIARSNNPLLRLTTVPNARSNQPLQDCACRWEAAGPASAAAFSGLGYLFGRDLQRMLGVPVGIIHASWGGTTAQLWLSPRTVAASADYRQMLTEARAVATPDRPSIPGELFDGMIAPLVPFAIRGVIWYQGESNANQAWFYRRLQADLIQSWRQAWGQGDFPFLAVQVAPFRAVQPQPGESTWAELREAQLIACRSVPNTALISTLDVGDSNNIHPPRKEPVSARLTLAALKIAYNYKLLAAGPTYRAARAEGNRVRISFDNVGSGLATKGPAPKGFAIAGPDRVFHWAQAAIDGDTVVCWSPEVSQPYAVRFGWADCPVCDLWNKEGLPAYPFRSDDFPLLTAPK